MSVLAAAAQTSSTPVLACGGGQRPGSVTGGARPAVRGPCNRPELLHLLPATGGAPPVLLTNFGMLLPSPGGSKYELVCEEYFGGRATGRIQRRADGQLLAPGANGVYLSIDGCGFAQAMGSVAGKDVVDLAVAPPAAGQSAGASTVWALVKEGPTAASLHVSNDGGASFSLAQALPAGPSLGKLLVAPSDPATVYLAGFASGAPLVLMASSDGGRTFTARIAGPEVFARPATVTDVLGVSPTNPAVVVVAAGSPEGADELWRSSDGGVSWTRLLTLRGLEILSGFTWLPGAGMAVAGRELFRKDGQPPAHLYVSADDGASFPEVIPSAENGPRYRCLAADGARLYACAGEDGDAFLVGHSDDGGRSWTGLARLADLEGSRPCAQGRCLLTATWLCETYRAACAGLATTDRPPEVPDAGPGDGGGGVPGDGAGGGCGCALAGAPSRAPVAALPLLMLALLTTLARARARRPTRRNV